MNFKPPSCKQIMLSKPASLVSDEFFFLDRNALPYCTFYVLLRGDTNATIFPVNEDENYLYKMLTWAFQSLT